MKMIVEIIAEQRAAENRRKELGELSMIVEHSGGGYAFRKHSILFEEGVE